MNHCSDVAMRDLLLQGQLEGTLCTLRGDKDNDVRCSAGGEPLVRCLTINSVSSESEEPWFQDQDNHSSLELRGQKSPGFQQPSVENEGLQDVNNIEDSVFEVAQQFNETSAEQKAEDGERKEVEKVDEAERKEVEQVEEGGMTELEKVEKRKMAKGEAEMVPANCRGRNFVSVQIRGGEMVKWTKGDSSEEVCGPVSTEGE